jgi:hypothetical protein
MPYEGKSTLIQPLGSGVALTTASARAIGENISRTGLWIHNPNASINILVSPASVTTAPGGATPGAGWLLIFPGAFLQFDGLAAKCAWNAAMVSSTGVVSVLEWVA